METDQHHHAAEPTPGLRGAAAGHWRLLLATGAAAMCLFLGGLVGFAWGTSAGDPSRQVTGIVDHFNSHAVSLHDVEGEEDGWLHGAFVYDPGLDLRPGDTVHGTFVDFSESDRIDTFILEEIVRSGS